MLNLPKSGSLTDHCAQISPFVPFVATEDIPAVMREALSDRPAGSSTTGVKGRDGTSLGQTKYCEIYVSDISTVRPRTKKTNRD